MSLLNPLGLIALLSIVALIIIYIIKPNYQQKYISSTFVWKLSLKYMKKRLPVSKLRNILLIICQILILSLLAVVFTQPVEVIKAKTEEREIIAIIDSSASMRAQSDDESRFERAVNQVQKLSEEVLENNGIVSVILAGAEPEYLANRYRTANGGELDDVLYALIDDNACAYGSADIDASLTLADEILILNPYAEIFIYTDEEYLSKPDGITIVNVGLEEEWNAAILEASAIKQESFYDFEVDLACYGRNESLELNVEIYGVNADDSNSAGVKVTLSQYVDCENDLTKRVIFTRDQVGADDENTIYVSLSQDIYSFQSISISIQAEDSFAEDNYYNIYAGQKEILKVQYVSPADLSQSFFPSALLVLKSLYADRWDIQFKEIHTSNYALEGYDFYIFEHSLPSTLPTDGIVMLVNPDIAPSGAGFQVVGIRDFNKFGVNLTLEGRHDIINNIKPELITVTRYVRLSRVDPSYTVLMTCEDYPVLMAKNEKDSKIVVMSFSLSYSNLAVLTDFPVLIKNILNFYSPATIVGNSFEVDESVSLNARGESLEVTRSGEEVTTFTNFPANLSVGLPGTYELTQKTDFGKTITENIFVKIPAAESNIFGQKDGLDDPYAEDKEEGFYNDILFYFALAMMGLLFIEWWLQSRDNM